MRDGLPPEFPPPADGGPSQHCPPRIPENKLGLGGGGVEALVATAERRAAVLGPPTEQSSRTGSPTCHCRWEPFLPVSPPCLSAGWGLPGSCGPGSPRGQSLPRSGLSREQLQEGQQQQDLENKRTTSGEPVKPCQSPGATVGLKGPPWHRISPSLNWHCAALVSSSPTPTKLPPKDPDSYMFPALHPHLERKHQSRELGKSQRAER